MTAICTLSLAPRIDRETTAAPVAAFKNVRLFGILLVPLIARNDQQSGVATICKILWQPLRSGLSASKSPYLLASERG
jgi:hypothetical protein